ncbi:hypothetical protein VA7_gp24 [Bacteroides phage GEC_vB_Bfr_VA7]|nr:hypothetical protein VA7_gp24 [Bacteroides phage GEC_vB_Bfr_VA7]
MIMEIRNYVSTILPFEIVKAVKFNGDVHELAQLLPSFELLSAMDGVMMARINGNTFRVFDNDCIVLGEKVTYSVDEEMFDMLYEPVEKEVTNEHD